MDPASGHGLVHQLEQALFDAPAGGWGRDLRSGPARFSPHQGQLDRQLLDRLGQAGVLRPQPLQLVVASLRWPLGFGEGDGGEAGVLGVAPKPYHRADGPSSRSSLRRVTSDERVAT